MAHYPTFERISRAYVPPATLLDSAKTVPFYSNNNTALSAGLVEGYLYAEDAYPHTVRVVIDSYVYSYDNYLLCSSDGYDLTPFVY